MDWHRRRQGPDFLDVSFGTVDEICLVQDDDGSGAAFPGNEEVSFDAPRVEIPIESADEEHRVDVRRDDLLFGPIAGGAAREAAESREDGDDPGVAIACALSASDGWQDAVRRLRGAFAEEAPGLKERKDDLPDD